MALGALVGGITKGLLSGGSKKKKSGAKMAKSIVKKKKPKESVEVREKKKGGPLAIRPSSVIAFFGGDTSDKSESSATPNDVPSLFDRIKESLGRITKGLKNSLNFKKADEKSKEDQARKDAAKRREKLLESIKRFKPPGEGMAKKILGNAWNAMKRFFGNILIGGILVALLDNIKKIQEEIEKAINKIKEVWEKLEPFLTPIWDFLKWIVKEGIELTQKIWDDQFGGKGDDAGKNMKGEADKIDKELKKVDDQIGPLQKMFAGVVKFIEGLRNQPTEKKVKEDKEQKKNMADMKEKEQQASNDVVKWKESQKDIKVDSEDSSNNNQGVGKEVSEKMFPKSQQSEAQKGSDALNQFFGHKEEGPANLPSDLKETEQESFDKAEEWQRLKNTKNDDQSFLNQNNSIEIAMDTNRARSLIRSGQVPVLTPGQAKDILNNPGAAGDLDMDTIQILKRMMVQNTGNSSLVASISKEASYDAEGGSVLVVPMATGSGGSSAGGGGGGSGVLPIIVEVNNNDQRIQSRMYRA